MAHFFSQGNWGEFYSFYLKRGKKRQKRLTAPASKASGVKKIFLVKMHNNDITYFVSCSKVFEINLAEEKTD